jgi:hypothetical protein
MEYIESNYYPEKDDRSFLFVSLPELNNIETDETVFISLLRDSLDATIFSMIMLCGNHIKISLGLCSTTGTSLSNHIEDFLVISILILTLTQ